MRWRRVTHRLPLTGVAVAGAVIGHMVAYVLAIPSPTVRVAPLPGRRQLTDRPLLELVAAWPSRLLAATVAATLAGLLIPLGCWSRR